MKLKTCSQFLIAFLKYTLNLEYFEKIYQPHSLSINEIIKCEIIKCEIMKLLNVILGR